MLKGFFFSSGNYLYLNRNRARDAARPHVGSISSRCSSNVNWRLLYNILECGLFVQLISREISQATSSLFFSTRDSILEPRDSILETRDSILETFEDRESSLESRGSRLEGLSTYFWAVLYIEAERLSLSVTNPEEMISLAGDWSQLVYLACRDSNLARFLNLKYFN